MIDASPVAAPSGGVPDHLSACARMDVWGLSEAVKALCGAACCWFLYQILKKTSQQLLSLCTRRWRWYRLCMVRKEMKSTTIETKTEIDIEESFFPVPHFRKKIIYLADHRPEKNSDEYTESVLWFTLFCDRIIWSAKLSHICWITYLYVSAPNLPHSSVCFRLKQSNLVKKWYPFMSVRNAE